MHFKELFRDIPVFLAPMAGITDAPFRELVCSFGATAVVTEMISSEATIRNSGKTYKRLVNNNDNFLRIVQIMGSDPTNMAKSAIINENLGADVIDINMGCPARKVTSNESGAALMKNEDLAAKIVESVVKAVKIPVTLKMRLGWDAKNINCCKLAKKFESLGVRMLAIHCRTRGQMYSGAANWSAIKELLDTIKIPYLCNGDIKSGNDAIFAMRESGADGVLIGRGALGKPWLLKQVKEFLHHKNEIPIPDLEEQYRIVLKHFTNTLDFYGQQHGIRIFRKHFCWYSSGLPGASIFRKVMNEAENISFIKSYLEDFYSKCFRGILR
jgi:tRNA-dihydrouridine synthase B